MPDLSSRPVRMVFTSRAGGVSAAPYDSFNLGTHVGDDAFSSMVLSCAGLELSTMTECLRQDAISRSHGPLRDDMVVLAVRPETP